MHFDLFKIIILNIYLNIRLVQDDFIKHPKIEFLALPSHTFRAVTRKRLGEFFFFLHFLCVYTFFFNTFRFLCPRLACSKLRAPPEYAIGICEFRTWSKSGTNHRNISNSQIERNVILSRHS